MSLMKHIAPWVLVASISIQTVTPVFSQNLPSIDGSVAENALPVYVEERLGNIIRGQALSDRSFIADYDLYDYLNAMAERLAGRSSITNVTIFPIRDPQINAFALPGGVIAIHSGLFIKAQSESELAGVMAHEIGHVKHRHIAQKIDQASDGTWLMVASILGAIAASAAGGDAAMGVLMLTQAAAVDNSLSFSRYAERDADREGFNMLSSAGYDPRGMATFFARLAQNARLNAGQQKSFATTHPLSIERQSDMESRLLQKPVQIHTDSLDFILFQSLLQVEQVSSDEKSKIPELLQTFSGRVKTETTASAQLAAQFGLVRAQMRSNDWTAAEQSWKRLAEMAQKMNVKHLLIDRTAIEIAQGQQQYERVLSLVAKANQQWGSTASLTILKMEALKELGRFPELLQVKVDLPYVVPRIYDLQAQAYEKTQQLVQAYTRRADYYLSLSRTTAAIQQLQEALRYATLYQDKAILDTRIKELIEQRKEEDSLKKRFS